ncbi:MAG: hypothetical protein LC130_26665 [Bryobacterales bacterium]|nr:hypothetical protein [Bryobacterales bacterium]
MKLSFSATLLALCAPAWAQTNPWFYQPLGQVKGFLQLSDGQLQTILTNNDEYNRWASEKQTRIRQVQTEIAEETGKSPLDPNALGVRYAEVETICREMKEKANEYRTRNLEVLSQDQKTKLNVLEDAIKLAPLISQAQSGNLIGGTSYAPLFFTSTSASFSTSGAVLGGVIGAASGCYLPFPTAVVRSGDFTSASVNGNMIPASRTVGTPQTAPTSLRNATALRWFDRTTSANPDKRNQQ